MTIRSAAKKWLATALKNRNYQSRKVGMVVSRQMSVDIPPKEILAPKTKQHHRGNGHNPSCCKSAGL
jgi:hypothetical protein